MLMLSLGLVGNSVGDSGAQALAALKEAHLPIPPPPLHGLGVCIRMHLVNGTGNSLSGTADPGVVKQDKSSRGSVDTTKTCSGPQRVRMSSGERPIGAAKGKQSDTEALCQTPPLATSSGRFCRCQLKGAGVTLMHCIIFRTKEGQRNGPTELQQRAAEG